MTKPDRANEPSMDDILASIRRIIAEEPQPGAAATSGKPLASASPARGPIVRSAPVADMRPASGPVAAGQPAAQNRSNDAAFGVATARGEFATMDGRPTARAAAVPGVSAAPAPVPVPVPASASAPVPHPGAPLPPATGLSPQSHRQAGPARLGDALSALTTAKRSASPGDDLLQELSEEPAERAIRASPMRAPVQSSPSAPSPAGASPLAPTSTTPAAAGSPRGATVPTPDGFDRLRSALEAKTGQSDTGHGNTARTGAAGAGAPSPSGARDLSAMAEGERIERETMDRAERLARRAERLARQAQRDAALGAEKSAGADVPAVDRASLAPTPTDDAISATERVDTSVVSSALDALAAGLATPAGDVVASPKLAPVVQAPVAFSIEGSNSPASAKPDDTVSPAAKPAAPTRPSVSGAVPPATAEPDGSAPTAAPVAPPASAARTPSADLAVTAVPRASTQALATQALATPGGVLSPTVTSPEKVPTTTMKSAAISASPIPGAVRTLEDTVAEMLRPMLREWLDANMPRIVEKALKVELASTLPQREAPRAELPRPPPASERH